MENFWTLFSREVAATINLWGIRVYLYGLLLGIGVVAGITVSERLKGKIISQAAWTWITICGLIGARIYHVIDLWSFYKENLGGIFDIGNGGLGIFGAILGAAIATFAYSRMKKSSWLLITDTLALAAPLAQAIGRWGNFFNMEGFGSPTNLPWKIFISQIKRPEIFVKDLYFHPLFLYESLLDLMLCWILIRFAKQSKTGEITAVYLLGYGIIRLFMETMRLDTWIVGGFKMGYLFSLFCILGGMAILVFIKNVRTKNLGFKQKTPYY